MKKLLTLAAIAALALVSCQKNGPDTDDPNEGDGVSVEGLVFNEVNGLKGAKYIELYSNSDKEVSLEGVTIVKYDSSKDGGKSVTWTGAKGMTLKAKAWIYLESSDLSDEAEKGDPNYQYQSDNHVFVGGLSPKKNMKLELCGPDEKVLDTFTRGSEGAGWNQVGGYSESKEWSYCRVPDGNGKWYFAVPTKGAANGEKAGDISQEPEA